MKAAVRDRYGPPEVIEIAEIERPVPVANEVLVRVRAASVNRADLDGLYPRWQFMRAFLGIRRPRIRALGTDMAGVVESVGPTASRFHAGDQVFGDLFTYGLGAFAEYVCAPEKAFALMPSGMTFDEAATLPHSAVLALQGLRLRNGRTVGPGSKVLIVGASGNVGPFAVQIAKSLGADVTGVSSTEKLDFVRSLGADHVIDYKMVDASATGERYDWILDVEARQSFFRWRRALAPKGAYVTLGGPVSVLLGAGLLGPIVSSFSDKWSGVMFWWKPFHPPDVERLKALIADGQLRPAIDRRFPLAEVARALRHVDDGRARGKVVVTV